MFINAVMLLPILYTHATPTGFGEMRPGYLLLHTCHPYGVEILQKLLSQPCEILVALVYDEDKKLRR
jgi:hypothetical protein